MKLKTPMSIYEQLAHESLRSYSVPIKAFDRFVRFRSTAAPYAYPTSGDHSSRQKPRERAVLERLQGGRGRANAAAAASQTGNQQLSIAIGATVLLVRNLKTSVYR